MSIYSEYTQYIKEFIDTDSLQWTFKSHPTYTYVLEHVNYYQGCEYIYEIKKRFSSFFEEHKEFLIDLSKRNDRIGSPNKFYFEDFTDCSPTNLRYIFHSLLILSYMKELYIIESDIVEIGGGYGGLCFFMKNLCKFFDVKLISYTIFDLPEPLRLQQKFLSTQNIYDIQYNDLYNFSNLRPNSFLISCYAFSEIDMEIQKDYTERVLNPFISHGFLTWNHIPLYKFIENKSILSEREYPSTAEYNYYVRF